MKLARFTTPDGQRRHGIVDGTSVIDVSTRVPEFNDLLAVVAARETREDDLRWPIEDVRWDPPLAESSKVVCIGLSYAPHAAESARKPAGHVGRGFEVVEHTPLFLRYADTFVGAGESVVRPIESDSLDWEGEIALIIGAGGRRIPVESAMNHVAGYTCMAENTVREWQAHSTQATAGKNWAGSGALGPWVATTDEVGDEPLTVETLLNGQRVQFDSTANLSVTFAEMVAYISQITPLRTGDVIATGTPAGIGYRQEPPRYLRPGDELTVDVPRVGTLRHTVVDEHSS